MTRLTMYHDQCFIDNEKKHTPILGGSRRALCIVQHARPLFERDRVEGCW